MYTVFIHIYTFTSNALLTILCRLKLIVIYIVMSFIVYIMFILYLYIYTFTSNVLFTNLRRFKLIRIIKKLLFTQNFFCCCSTKFHAAGKTHFNEADFINVRGVAMYFVYCTRANQLFNHRMYYYV